MVHTMLDLKKDVAKLASQMLTDPDDDFHLECNESLEEFKEDEVKLKESRTL